MDETKCVLCEAFFRSSAMKEGKCPVCSSMYPTARSREDLKLKNKTKIQTLTEALVQQMIYDTLEEAGIKRFECEKCGKLYFRTSPAQKQCPVCRSKESK